MNTGIVRCTWLAAAKISVDLNKQTAMKPLLFLLVFSALAITVAAQEIKGKLEKTTGKNGLRLDANAPATPVFKPGSTLVQPPGVYFLGKMPCLVPDTKDIVAIPNALPELKIPDVAAIPNPAHKTGRELYKKEK